MDDGLVEVRLVDLPVALHQRTSQHIDDLRREFTYIAAEPGSVPQRLLDLAHHIGAEFGRFSEGPRAALHEAADAGRESVELVYRFPPHAAVAARQADDMLDEADAFCRDGQLLTLAAEPEALAYRRWFFGEVMRQIEGEAPRPWPEYRAAAVDG